MTLLSIADWFVHFLMGVIIGLGLAGYIKTFFLQRDIKFLLDMQQRLLDLVKDIMDANSDTLESVQELTDAMSELTKTPNEQENENTQGC